MSAAIESARLEVLEPAAVPAPAPAPAFWQRRYVRRLALGDALAVIGSCAVACAVHNPEGGGGIRAGGAALALATAASWLLLLAGARAYENRFLGCGSEEYKRVTQASVHLVVLLALLSFAGRLPIARSFVGAAILVGTGALLAHRFAARRFLYRARESGRDLHRVLVVGDPAAAAALVAAVQREPRAGFDVVATYSPDSPEAPDAAESVVAAAHEFGADTIAVTSSPGNTAERLRRIAWDLEGTGIALIVAPALTDVAGPRVSIRPVAGLPLLHVEQPDITGARYLLKELVERAIALSIVVVTLPLMLAVAMTVKLTSPGPMLFSQIRVSRHGREFRIYKFRSMRVDAESLLAALQQRNDGDGLLFKVRNDPRVTRVGRWLRRYSLDELPQLFNVIRGDMALVGPRPPLPGEVAAYSGGVGRRLLVKPGITGLWQVSGRSDLSWEESVRLDLYYVENWSLALDAQILMRTLRAVVRGTGAY